MNNSLDSYGIVSGHVVGIIMKELVRRAIAIIRAQQFTFEATSKVSLGKTDDYVTSADKAAQEIYLKSLRECFPEFGIIGEENNLRVQPIHPAFYFSLDPLDGTKAFMRHQSHGVGTMIALRANGKIIAAYVGDVNTHEIFGFRPGSAKVHMISEYEIPHRLTIDRERPLSDQYVLLRDAPWKYSELITHLVESQDTFKDMEITGGSIGVQMARLWKGEVGAIVLRPGHDTPWDMWPIIGISQQMGFIFLRPTIDGKGLEQYQPIISTELQERTRDMLIVHSSRLDEVKSWFS